jgi:hypothetical protein
MPSKAMRDKRLDRDMLQLSRRYHPTGDVIDATTEHGGIGRFVVDKLLSPLNCTI